MPAKPGSYQRRQPPPGAAMWHLKRIPSRLEVALKDGVDAEKWEALREAAWALWLELVQQPHVSDHEVAVRRATERYYRPPRDNTCTWPPAAASHDGIHGKVLATNWNSPEGYTGGFDARPRIRELAEEGLAELEGFHTANPKAAESVAPALRHYEKLLHEVREHPELRLLDFPPAIPQARRRGSKDKRPLSTSACRTQVDTQCQRRAGSRPGSARVPLAASRD